jgi:hypothetical protein
MIASALPTLLAETPAGRHLAQFHRNRETLADAAHRFLEGGLRRDHSVVVIALADHTEEFLERLAGSNVDVQALSRAGQLDIVDAATLLDQLMSSGSLETARFRQLVGAILARVRPFGRGIRIYGELADVLWQAGNTTAAVQLEELWNWLARAQNVAIYCGYTLDTQCENSYAGPLEDLGHAHSEILGSEDDERFGVALDRASKEIFGISLSQMAGVNKEDGARRFPSGQRSMLWVKRNLPLSTSRLAEQARRYFKDNGV